MSEEVRSEPLWSPVLPLEVSCALLPTCLPPCLPVLQTTTVTFVKKGYLVLYRPLPSKREKVWPLHLNSVGGRATVRKKSSCCFVF